MDRLEQKDAQVTSHLLSGLCPDRECGATLYFPKNERSIECTNCGQRHEVSSLHKRESITNAEVAIAAIHDVLKSYLIGNVKPKKGPDNVKVIGMSNYICKLVSPILCKYGMDKSSGKAKLLIEMGQKESFDCGILGDRAFLIEQENIEISGYGKDRSGSQIYLKDTLLTIQLINGNEERLVPVHADGDGHCLVHAVSRALVGRELFWYPLRKNLSKHFHENIAQYKLTFQDFVDRDEWNEIINECDPHFVSLKGEPLGLRNIHVFGLANVLKRPIILLDSIGGMQSLGDYSGVFLPAFCSPSDCASKDGIKNKPICIAWSSKGRNHYIPLVGIKGKPLPRLPQAMLQRSWGTPSHLIKEYIDFDENGHCVIGGSKCLQERYLLRLVLAMEEVFADLYGVQASLVADLHQYVYRASGIVGVGTDEVIAATQRALKGHTLYRCLTCEALCEYKVSRDWLEPCGSLYELAVNAHGPLQVDKKYTFTEHGLVCKYDPVKDILLPDMAASRLPMCVFCKGQSVRLLREDGNIAYESGDRTFTRTTTSRCACGFKHFWEGAEYDNLPELLPIRLEWDGRTVIDTVAWFRYETDPSRNSNVFDVAPRLVQKHFPGEFGAESLVQRVVEMILRQTETSSESDERLPDPQSPSPGMSLSNDPAVSTPPSTEMLQKMDARYTEGDQVTPSLITQDASSRPSPSKVHQQHDHQQRDHQPHDHQQHDHQQQQRQTVTTCSSSTTQAVVGVASTMSGGGVPGAETVAGDLVKEKRIRLAASNGRQAMLTLSGDITYDELSERISRDLEVARDRQRLRHGFPPRELVPPPDPSTPLPLQHGDKIIVEILAKDHPQAPRPNVDHEQMDVRTTTHHIKPHISPCQTTTPMVKTGKENVDISIASLSLMATIAGRDLWSYIQQMPNLFSKRGLFYLQVERDLGLVDGKHCILPALPGKTFRYNATSDRLELCLEPLGHFPVQPDVENIARRSSADSHGSGVRSSASTGHGPLTIGGSGAVKQPSSVSSLLFSGHGHRLCSDGDTDLKYSTHTKLQSDQFAPQDKIDAPSPNVSSIRSKVVPTSVTATTESRHADKRLTAKLSAKTTRTKSGDCDTVSDLKPSIRSSSSISKSELLTSVLSSSSNKETNENDWWVGVDGVWRRTVDSVAKASGKADAKLIKSTKSQIDSSMFPDQEKCSMICEGMGEELGGDSGGDAAGDGEKPTGRYMKLGPGYSVLSDPDRHSNDDDDGSLENLNALIDSDMKDIVDYSDSSC